MIRGLFAFFVSGLMLAQLSAQSMEMCDSSEPACVLEAAWGAALILPEDKQKRLAPLFIEIAALSDDARLTERWAQRLQTKVSHTPQAYPDFGWTVAEPILNKSGVDGLIRSARDKQGDVSIGRADALLAAGKKLQTSAPDDAAKINQAMLDMTISASSFEKPVLAHAAAELAMVRCDAARFDRALLVTDAPSNLRYAFWRARINGDATKLLNRVRDEATDEDTRHVRQVLSGYRSILELGYCGQ